MIRPTRFAILMSCLATLAACDGDVDDGVVDVAFIAQPSDLAVTGLRMESPAQHLYAAEAQGLVRLDANGNVVPGLAERWIVTDDGRSYIFRILEYDLPGGGRLTAQAVRDSLRRTRERLRGTSLGLDLERVADIRAMTGRVIEFRLTRPMPDFLQLLAQPEMGVVVAERRNGPMRVKSDGDGAFKLAALPPEARGLPRQPAWDEGLHEVRASVASARDAAEGFAEGRYDLVLGGTVATLPLAGGGALTRGTIRLDPAMGLLGLDVRRTRGFLSEPANREALALAIDRDALMQPFNVGGWSASALLVPDTLPMASPAGAEPRARWNGADIASRRATAASRVAAWRASAGAPPQVALYLPAGPGSATLFTALARDFATIGVSTRRAAGIEDADLVLRDKVARYGSPYWFFNQFNCRIAPGQCSPATDTLVRLAATAQSTTEERSYLAEAEKTLLGASLYIPLGAPIRWSLARASLTGFAENPWAIHPLFPLARAPI